MEFPHSHAMAICQTAEVHEEIATLFAALRLAREKQLKAARALAQVEKQQPQPATPEPMQIRVYPLALPPGGQGGGFSAMRNNAPNDDAAKEQVAQSSHASSGAAKRAESQRDNRAKEFAAILPEIIAPESWAPHGKGKVWAVGDRLIVRQSETVHQKLEQLLVRELMNWLLGGFLSRQTSHCRVSPCRGRKPIGRRQRSRSQTSVKRQLRRRSTPGWIYPSSISRFQMSWPISNARRRFCPTGLEGALG